MRYRNFDISIDERVSEGYPLRAESETFGETRGLLTLDPGSSGIREDLMALDKRATDREFLVRLGTNLYRLLFNGEIETLFQQSNGEALGEEDTGLRVRLRIQPPEMTILPWELFYLPSSECFMGTSERTPIVRYLEIHQRIRSLEAHFPLNVLVVIPQYPDPDLALDSGKEKQQLENVFNLIKKYVIVTFLEGPVSVNAISDAMTDRPYNCFHFIGHGEFKEDRGMILLNSENGGIDYVDEDRFAGLFQNHPAMKLVMLNSCKGAATSASRPMVGMAPKLVRLGIPAVIAMQYAIFDEAAVFFAREFYHKLFKGWDTGRVDIAITHARSRLASEFSNDRDMCTPVLFMRAREGVLFNPLTGNPVKDIPFSKQDLHRSEAIAQTYIGNNAVKKTQEDTDELKRLVQRIKFRRYAQIMAIGTVLLMFFLSWINVFDYFNLDTRIETYTMALGEYFTTKTFSDKIVMIYAEDESFGIHWRGERHPALLDLLARAGARVIVFDMVFETGSEEFDPKFIDALRKAKVEGVDVIAGIRDADLNGPKIVKGIAEAVSGVGITCIGEKLGHSRTSPLAVLERGEGNGESKKGRYHSIALEAYADYHGYTILDVDLKDFYVNLNVPAEGTSRRIPFAELIKAKKTKECPAIEKGDEVVDIFIDPIPIELLREKEITYSEAMDANNIDLFRDKIVLIGAIKGDINDVKSITGENRFGFELHAEALNTLINGVFIHSLNIGWQFIIMIILGFLGAFIRYWTPETSRILRRVLSFSVLVAYLAGTILLYARYRLLLNTLYHIGAFGLSYWAVGKIERRVLQ